MTREYQGDPTMPVHADISEVLFTEAVIQAKVKELGRQISEDYRGKTPIVVGVLKGVLFLLSDLLRSIDCQVELDVLAVSSYSPETRNQGYVRIIKDLEMPIQGRHVLFVEDVIDTGLTLNFLLNSLRTREPASLEVCVLFDRRSRRLIDIPLKYRGFELPERFVVGYGLDYREKYRHLPYVGVLKAVALD